MKIRTTNNDHSLTQLEELLAEAKSCYVQGDFDGANVLFQGVLNIQPGNVMALHNLGLIAYEIGMLDISVEFMNEALKTDPNNMLVMINLALVYTRLACFVDAKILYEMVLELDNDNVDVRSELARLNILTGCNDKALEHYTIALKHSSTAI